MDQQTATHVALTVIKRRWFQLNCQKASHPLLKRQQW
jgi:hypothetical protein